jgi:hypothetical protein
MGRPPLSQILSDDPDHVRELVLGDPRAVANQARSATEEERAELVTILESCWPTAGFSSEVEHDGRGNWRIGPRAHAWLTLGPVIDAPLSAEQWAEIATSGIAVTEQARWLSEQYDEQRLQLAVEYLDTEDEVSRWSQLVASIPQELHLPEVLIAALEEGLRQAESDAGFFHLAYIGRRLADAGALETLRGLEAVSEDFADSLRKPLATAGDRQAARALLAELLGRLQEGERVDRHEAEWLRGVADPELLDPLFECLVAAYEPPTYDPFDVSGSLIAAIRRIGGDEAIRRYDDLLEAADKPRLMFLRRAREEIVQDELRKVGQVQAPRTAESLGFPYLGIEFAERGQGDPSTA